MPIHRQCFKHVSKRFWDRSIRARAVGFQAMSSAASDPYSRVEDRTEREIAAEVIVQLFEHQVVRFSAVKLIEASKATGVPVADIKRAWAARSQPRAPFSDATATGNKPRSRARLNVVKPAPKPIHSENYHPKAREANERKRAKKEPTPSTRICSKCKKEKPKSEYGYKDKRTLTLRSMCGDCYREYQNERRLTSEQLERLGPVLRFVLEHGDAHAGMICPDCREPCRPGDEVVASDAIVRHAFHHSGDAATPIEVGKPV